MNAKELSEHLAACHLGSAAHQKALSDHHEKLASYHLATSPALSKIHSEMADLCRGRSRFHERSAAELDVNSEPESPDVEVGSSSLSSGSSSSATSKLQRATLSELLG